ncbi:MAG TPA: SDR family oxidoreductase [Saprospiraceae bacterium]|nr:SDR family oxidoreductase [Flavobacteriales bacterium]HRJ39058.1 SDR family oxidoreductase [Flavobacteriales bacterium]HRQ30897.1 SDR family oxidoreductase [Saprospiraceae bacterium]
MSGATSPIGHAICERILEMGGKVIALGRNQNKLSDLVNKSTYPENLQTEYVDFELVQSIEDLVKRLPPINGFVSAAAQLLPMPVQFLQEEVIEKVMKVNFHSPVFLVSRLFSTKKVISGSSFVFISSVSSNHPYIGGVLYTAAKAALENFAKVIALEMKSLKIRSNSIQPAMVHSGMFDQTEAFIGKEKMDEHLKNYPLGPGFPDDVAWSSVFLLSDAARWISGTKIVLDGGLTMYP